MYRVVRVQNIGQRPAQTGALAYGYSFRAIDEKPEHSSPVVARKGEFDQFDALRFQDRLDQLFDTLDEIGRAHNLFRQVSLL